MEVVNSFFNNIKDKLTNPFFGTLILVLIIHHWQLWYTVLNFDSDCTLEDKVEFIRTYSRNFLTFKKFMWDVLQAGLYMLMGYLIIIVTRSLVLWIEFWLMPLITGKIINKNVVRKSDYDEVVREREQYFDLYEEQRKNVRNFSKTIDEQTEQIKQKDISLLEQSESISNSVNEINKLSKTLDNVNNINRNQESKIKKLESSLNVLQRDFDLKVREIRMIDSLYFSKTNIPFYSSYEKFPPEIINKVRELKSQNLWEIFLLTGNFFEKGGTLGSQELTKMIEKGIAFERTADEDLTPIGKIIWKYHKVFESMN